LGQRALVTGAGGFIGSHLVEELVERGWDVRAFVRYNSQNSRHNLDLLAPAALSSVEVVTGDVADAFSVDRAVAGCDVVFHLAALIGIPYSYVAPSSYVATNVSGTLNVLEAARRHGVSRVIHTSTSETYGSAQYVPIDERHPLVGQSPYSATKIGADKLAESFHLSFGTPVTIVRPFNTYGPRQSLRAVIPTVIVQALTRDSLSLGSLDPMRDFTFVSDTVAGFLAAAESQRVVGETVNLGVGAAVSVRELVERVGALLGRRLLVAEDRARVRPERSEVSRLVSDNTKARELMDWRPAVGLDAGLERTLAYLRERLPELRGEQYVI
jgi:NAD dependent epimerase/dehydratase